VREASVYAFGHFDGTKQVFQALLICRPRRKQRVVSYYPLERLVNRPAWPVSSPDRVGVICTRTEHEHSFLLRPWGRRGICRSARTARDHRASSHPGCDHSRRPCRARRGWTRPDGFGQDSRLRAAARGGVIRRSAAGSARACARTHSRARRTGRRGSRVARHEIPPGNRCLRWHGLRAAAARPSPGCGHPCRLPWSARGSDRER
jgi:hypothetical protein